MTCSLMMWLQQNQCEGSHAEEEKNSKSKFLADGPTSATSAQKFVMSRHVSEISLGKITEPIVSDQTGSMMSSYKL